MHKVSKCPRIFPPLSMSKWTQRTDYKYSDSCLSLSRCCDGTCHCLCLQSTADWPTPRNKTQHNNTFDFMQQVLRPAHKNNKHNKGSKQSFFWKHIHCQGDKLQHSKVVVTSLWCDLHWLIWRPARRLTKKSRSRRAKKNPRRKHKHGSHFSFRPRRRGGNALSQEWKRPAETWQARQGRLWLARSQREAEERRRSQGRRRNLPSKQGINNSCHHQYSTETPAGLGSVSKCVSWLRC